MLLLFNILGKSYSVEHFSWSHTDSGITHLTSGSFCVCEFLNLGGFSTSTYDSWMSSSVSRYLSGRGDIDVPSGKETCSEKWPTDLCSGKLESSYYCETITSCVCSGTSQDDPDSQEQKLLFTTMNFYWITLVYIECLERRVMRIRQKGWIWQKCRSPKIISYTENQHVQNVLALTAHLRQILLFFSSKNQIETPQL